ncbi:glycogen synthase GlgA [Candidatus Sumerlaeota bacterium]|nr:glycogen synthase GlgA [Candidatus Sumerlaeales bacterium]NLD62090.1 glycogen synthase GlgA [Candidatus Sumerlaeota bacterium]
MNILILSSEAVPFAKTGGLADVSTSLCVELNRLGHDARLLIPEYCPAIDRSLYTLDRVMSGLKVVLGGHEHICNIEKCRIPGTSQKSHSFVYFVQYGGFFERPGMYSESGIDYWDNPQRFAYLCKTALEWCLAEEWIPDVIHCNDWQTALLPVYLKTHVSYRDNPLLDNVKVLMSIHNLSYQGRFDSWYNPEIEVGPEVFHLHGLEFYGDLNLLKGGIMYADRVSTVSPTYAMEIQTSEFGCGLDGVLQARSEDLSGILNGIDESVWKPSVDKAIAKKYSLHGMNGKKACKKALQEELGLKVDENIPMIGLISRLTYQKGFDLFLSQLDALLSRDVQVVVLGTGDNNLVHWLDDVARRYPSNVAVALRFDEGLSHRILAGSDLFLMPSRFEPCGLTQMYAMKYGTVPVVRATGGLKDSVIDATPTSLEDGTATGFCFERFDGWDMIQALDRALDMYRNDAAQWKKLMKNGMSADFSWSSSAKSYVELYQSMM